MSACIVWIWHWCQWVTQTHSFGVNHLYHGTRGSGPAVRETPAGGGVMVALLQTPHSRASPSHIIHRTGSARDSGRWWRHGGAPTDASQQGVPHTSSSTAVYYSATPVNALIKQEVKDLMHATTPVIPQTNAHPDPPVPSLPSVQVTYPQSNIPVRGMGGWGCQAGIRAWVH